MKKFLVILMIAMFAAASAFAAEPKAQHAGKAAATKIKNVDKHKKQSRTMKLPKPANTNTK